MLERARGSERRGVVILKCLECIEREREMCCKCLKYVREGEREREAGVCFCKHGKCGERDAEGVYGALPVFEVSSLQRTVLVHCI